MDLASYSETHGWCILVAVLLIALTPFAFGVRIVAASTGRHENPAPGTENKPEIKPTGIPTNVVKQHETSAQRDGELFALAARLAHMGPWEYHPAKELFDFNDEFYAIYGTDVAREGPVMSLADYIQNFVHPEDIALVMDEAAKRACAQAGTPVSEIEHRIVRRDGEVRTILYRGYLVHDDTGAVVKCYGANQDITERKAVESALCESRELLVMAAELGHVGPWKFHPDKWLFEFSDDFYALYGTSVAREGAFMSPETYFREFMHPEDREAANPLTLEKSLTGDEKFVRHEVEHRIIRRDGAVRHIVVRGHVTRDNDGRVLKWWGMNQDITMYREVEAALKQKRAEIYRMAYTDALTGLSNRAHLNEWLEEKLGQARCGKTAGTVLFVDLDDLKTVNDSMGHSYGDAIIAEAGRRIAKEAGERAFVSRVGGDEFVIVWPDLGDRRRVAPMVDRMLAVLCREAEVFRDRFTLSASIGVGLYPQDGDTVEEILKNTDNAMYAAKNSGKNCWKFYDTAMQAAAYETMQLTKSLHHALARGEFELHYQPQVSIPDGVTVGFEALLRWNSREYGSVSPERFIPLAEHCGQIRTIGNWVLNEACRFIRNLTAAGNGHVFVAVNISPYQLNADDFTDNIREALRAAGVNPGQLELEITESALITSLQESVQKLEELRRMGVRLALDDFGTGYSSLTYLQQLPVQTLKIDKSFIDTIRVAEPQQAIIRSIVDMAHIMKMNVIAEGVETEEQLAYLIQSRCDIAQGYYYSRPMPAKDAMRLWPRCS